MELLTPHCVQVRRGEDGPGQGREEVQYQRGYGALHPDGVGTDAIRRVRTHHLQGRNGRKEADCLQLRAGGKRARQADVPAGEAGFEHFARLHKFLKAYSLPYLFLYQCSKCDQGTSCSSGKVAGLCGIGESVFKKSVFKC